MPTVAKHGYEQLVTRSSADAEGPCNMPQIQRNRTRRVMQ